MKKKQILILGSEGLIGKALCKKLKDNYRVFHFDKKINFDINNSVESFLIDTVQRSDFVFFLAFDVGGSQYLEKFEHTKAFISNNVQMMERIFNVLEKEYKPFVFASSMMTKIPHSTYGTLKSLGERYTKSLNGISVRFWNVYGVEEIEINKNHVMTDFIISALKDKQITCKTDGKEVRQFIHADDASEALKTIMENYDEAINLSKDNNNCIDVTNNKWESILDIARIIAHKTNTVFYKTNIKDRVQKNLKIEPNLSIINQLNWKPTINLESGIDQLIKHYKDALNDK